ncbi:MAG: Unknown protein [uncultured Sulfurovum sp.]|uniref:Fe2OG dioxygenase domain-containing protein n=1 Tax=uncultured Sulfurovum sp. TaxID=269237 RepID=A0A6S6SDL2_9BACT|nr:MAG: Unknown protein [uncultured Sulfurovum sp.]
MKKLADNIFQVDNFLTPLECKKYIELAESNGMKKATINTSNGAVENNSVRNNTRFTYDNVAFSEELWKRMKHYLPKNFNARKVDSLNSRIQFYRYDVGQKFDWHVDGFYAPNPFTTSYFTFFVYLNDDFKGGGTSFENVGTDEGFIDFTVQPKVGTALFFYHRYRHRGDEVIKGVKYAMRSDVLYSSGLGIK